MGLSTVKLSPHIKPNSDYDSDSSAKTVLFTCVGLSDAAGVRAFYRSYGSI